MVATPDIITDRKSNAGRVLLPYQEAWRRDRSPLKIWEKSRRIGATYCEANDATMTRLTGERNWDYWFSSADESAAFEFAEYCRYWHKVAGVVADYFTDDIEDQLTKRTATAFCIRFESGARITAMSSSPRRFRSKGGDICLDEFAYHDDPGAMWDAASPTATHGFMSVVMSTHNGEGTEFYRFVEQGKRHAAGKSKQFDMPWSVHRVTIEQAVEMGLVEKVVMPRRPDMTREQFLAECRARCRNDDQWNQEYLAIPSVDSSAWLPYELIEACEHDDAGKPEKMTDGLRYVGCDVGEQKDPSRIVVGERVGDVIWVREDLRLVGVPLSRVESLFLERLNHPKTVRGCVDATGLGTQIGQAAEKTNKGEAVKFTLPSMDAMASPMRGMFEDRRVRVPGDRAVREDLHSIRMERTASGSPRFVAPRTDAGHADFFWAMALMLYAAKTPDVIARASYL